MEWFNGYDEIMYRIMQVSADHTDSLDEVRAGQIVALHGLTSVKTGDTLITPKVYVHSFSPRMPSFQLSTE